MFFIHYSIVVETKNEEGETVSEVQNKVIHIRTKETYENLLNQIEDNEDNEIEKLINLMSSNPKIADEIGEILKKYM